MHKKSSSSRYTFVNLTVSHCTYIHTIYWRRRKLTISIFACIFGMISWYLVTDSNVCLIECPVNCNIYPYKYIYTLDGGDGPIQIKVLHDNNSYMVMIWNGACCATSSFFIFFIFTLLILIISPVMVLGKMNIIS